MGSLLSPPISGAVMSFDPFGIRTEADPEHQYGSLVATNHARDAYRYGKVGASNVSKAKLQLAPAPVANHMNILMAAAAALDANQVTVTLGATAAVAGEYDQGHFITVDGTGEGQTLGILHNAGAALSTNCLVDLDDGLLVALATTSEVALVHNPYNGFVEAAVQTRTAAGVALRDLTAGDFGWLKSKGIAGVVGGSAVSLGGDLGSDASTAGSVTDATDQTGVDTVIKVARASIVAGVTGEEFPVFVTVD